MIKINTYEIHHKAKCRYLFAMFGGMIVTLIPQVTKKILEFDENVCIYSYAFTQMAVCLSLSWSLQIKFYIIYGCFYPIFSQSQIFASVLRIKGTLILVMELWNVWYNNCDDKDNHLILKFCYTVRGTGEFPFVLFPFALSFFCVCNILYYWRLALMRAKVFHISTTQGKPIVLLFLRHWRYPRLALNHQCILTRTLMIRLPFATIFSAVNWLITRSSRSMRGNFCRIIAVALEISSL